MKIATGDKKAEGKSRSELKSQRSATDFAAANDVRNFQRKIGNQAILGLLRSGTFQAKLAVSRFNDIYEQEADRVADKVMRMPAPVIHTSPG